MLRTLSVAPSARSAFDVLLGDGNMGAYNAACGQVAAAFADISREVNELGTSLRNAGRADLFEAVRSLQQHEKEQLRLVRLWWRATPRVGGQTRAC